MSTSSVHKHPWLYPLGAHLCMVSAKSSDWLIAIVVAFAVIVQLACMRLSVHITIGRADAHGVPTQLGILL